MGRRLILSALFLSVALLAIVFLVPARAASREDSLTPEERAWAKAHSPIRYAPDPSFPPFEFIDSMGRVVGITPDLLAKMGDNLNVEFTSIKYATWSEVVEAARRGEVDMLGTLTRTPEREDFLFFSEPYLSLPYVLFVREDGARVASMEALEGRRWGVVKGYGINAWLAAKHPKLKPVEVENAALGLSMVSTGELDAMLETLPVGLHVIRERSLSNVGMVPTQVYLNPQHFGIRKSAPLLLSIIDKGLKSLAPAERTGIFVHWTGQDFTRPQPEISPFWRNALLTLLAVVLSGVVWIISLRKGIERRTAALAASEERFRTLVELAADAIFQGNPEGKIIGINASATALTGYSREELLAMSLGQLFSERELERAPLRFDLVREGNTVRNERFLTRKDSSVVPVDMNSRMMPDGSYQSFIRDIGERVRAEEVLRASEEKFSTAFNHAPLLMTISELETGRFLDVNKKFCDVSGFTRGETIGKTSIELGWLNAESRDRLVADMKSRGRISEIELELTAKDGTAVFCLYSAELVQIEGKTRFLSIALDISEKKRLQEELDKTQRLESLGVLAGGIAHDFNNILTGILGNISLAQSYLDESSRARKCLDECEKASLRAGQLVHQLLTFARGGAPVKKVLAVGPLVEETVTFVLRGSKVKGNVELAEGLLAVEADEGQLSQALNNLLINAVQAMPMGGMVTVRVKNTELGTDNPFRLAPGAYIALSVSDQGHGIPKENLAKVFDPYFTTKSYGTGLGLATVFSIVTRHRGFVGVDSTVGVGTTFTILIPATTGPLYVKPVPQKSALARGHGRILVMDDDDTIRQLLVSMLDNLGYEAKAVTDGGRAIAEVREAVSGGRPFRAAILDLTVPGGVGGMEAAKSIREVAPEVKLLVSSGYSNDTVMSDFGAHSFDGSIPKPYRMAQLAKELTRVLREVGADS